MPNSQIDFTKVKTNFLDPLTKHFGKKLSDEQIEAYIEDLAEFKQEILSQAWVHCRRKNKYFPSIYEAIQACEEEKNKKQSASLAPLREYYAEKQKSHDDIAVQVMKSELGQLSLKEGWANSLFIITKRTGKYDWDSSDAIQFRISFQKAVEAATECYSKSQIRTPEEQQKLYGRQVDAALNRSLLKLWDAMQLSEKSLYEKFYNQKVA